VAGSMLAGQCVRCMRYVLCRPLQLLGSNRGARELRVCVWEGRLLTFKSPAARWAEFWRWMSWMASPWSGREWGLSAWQVQGGSLPGFPTNRHARTVARMPHMRFPRTRLSRARRLYAHVTCMSLNAHATHTLIDTPSARHTHVAGADTRRSTRTHRWCTLVGGTHTRVPSQVHRHHKLLHRGQRVGGRGPPASREEAARARQAHQCPRGYGVHRHGARVPRGHPGPGGARGPHAPPPAPRPRLQRRRAPPRCVRRPHAACGRAPRSHAGGTPRTARDRGWARVQPWRCWGRTSRLPCRGGTCRRGAAGGCHRRGVGPCAHRRWCCYGGGDGTCTREVALG
jgi:hypothetical protein